MLAARNRMRRSSDFGRTMRRGRRAGSSTVVLHRWSPAPSAHSDSSVGSDENPRVGLVVSKAVGPSVVRHRVSRRLRHVARSRLGDLRPGEYVVIRATSRAATASSARLADDLDRCLRMSALDVDARRSAP